MIGWTTFASQADAEKLGDLLVAEGLAACTQMDGPIRSTYRWKGELCHDSEYRLTVKFLESRARSILEFIQSNHPYESPQWLACRAIEAAPAYQNWAAEQTKREEAG